MDEFTHLGIVWEKYKKLYEPKLGRLTNEKLTKEEVMKLKEGELLYKFDGEVNWKLVSGNVGKILSEISGIPVLFKIRSK